MPVIGVALSIPEPWATELQDYRTGLDPSAALIPTHITLVPPTEIDPDDLANVQEHLAKVAEGGSAFEVEEFHLYVHDAVDGWQPTRDFVLQGSL